MAAMKIFHAPLPYCRIYFVVYLPEGVEHSGPCTSDEDITTWYPLGNAAHFGQWSSRNTWICSTWIQDTCYHPVHGFSKLLKRITTIHVLKCSCWIIQARYIYTQGKAENTRIHMRTESVVDIYNETDCIRNENIYNMSNSSSLDIDCGTSIEHLVRFKDFMVEYVAPFLILGVPVNVLVYILFSVGDLSKGTTSMLFRILAVVDAVVVCLIIGLHYIPLLFGNSITPSTDVTCKMLPYLYAVCRSMSAWTLIIIGVERVIGLSWPHRAYVICTRKYFGTILLCTGAIVSALYGPLIVSVKMDFDDNVGVHVCHLHNLPGLSSYFILYMDILLGSLLPMTAITINNVLIFRAIRHSKKVRRQSYVVNQGPQQDHVVPMLVTASTVFFFLRLPMVVSWIMEINIGNHQCLRFVAMNLNVLGNICDGINHSINMFLYCLCGQNVRRQLRVILMCGCCKCVDLVR